MSSSSSFQLLKQSLFDLAKQNGQLPSEVVSIFLQNDSLNPDWLLLTTSDQLIYNFDQEFIEQDSLLG